MISTFARPEVYEYLKPWGMGYAIRLPANEVIQEHIKHLLKRLEGRLPKPALSGAEGTGHCAAFS